MTNLFTQLFTAAQPNHSGVHAKNPHPRKRGPGRYHSGGSRYAKHAAKKAAQRHQPAALPTDNQGAQP